MREAGGVPVRSCCPASETLALVPLEVVIERLGSFDAGVIDPVLTAASYRFQGPLVNPGVPGNGFEVAGLQRFHNVVEHLTHAW